MPVQPNANVTENPIFRYRGATGMTQGELAGVMKVRRQTVMDWERGRVMQHRCRPIMGRLLDDAGIEFDSDKPPFAQPEKKTSPPILSLDALAADWRQKFLAASAIRLEKGPPMSAVDAQLVAKLLGLGELTITPPEPAQE